MSRAVFSLALLIGASALLVAAQSPGDGRRPADASPFQVVEAGIREIRAAMASGRATSRALVSQYLMRIRLYEERLKAGLLVGQGRAPSGAGDAAFSCYSAARRYIITVHGSDDRHG